MPLFFWKMIARAEHKLSQDLAAEHYEMEHDEDSTSPKTIEASR